MAKYKSVCSLLAVIFILSGNDAEAVRNEHRPVCSPDGSRLIYMLQSKSTNDDWELYLIERESQQQSRLTSHLGWDGYAVWSPDGTKIIFDREDVPDAQKRPWITDDPSWDHMPEFCHSSQTLFFTSYRSGEERIYQIDPDPKPYLKIERAQNK
ncbi:MAG: Tol biopolymer transport system component [Lysobacterales bacterium]|jgi:Tol biopolymer transport system component